MKDVKHKEAIVITSNENECEQLHGLLGQGFTRVGDSRKPMFSYDKEWYWVITGAGNISGSAGHWALKNTLMNYPDLPIYTLQHYRVTVAKELVEPITPPSSPVTWEEALEEAEKHANKETAYFEPGSAKTITRLTLIIEYLQRHPLHPPMEWVKVEDLLKKYNPHDSPVDNKHMQEIIRRFIDTRLKPNFNLTSKSHE